MHGKLGILLGFWSVSDNLGHHAVAKAGDHAHDLPHRAHLQDVLQLVLQNLHGEIALLDALHHLLLHLILRDCILHCLACIDDDEQ